jgi:CheY-like chemotaxis protein
VPIIGLTADVIKEHMDEYKKHGFTTILTKPVYLEELIRAINKYL